MSDSDIDVDIDQVEVQRVLDALGSNKMLRTVQSGMIHGLDEVHGQLPGYPEVRTVTQVTRASSLWSRGARAVSGGGGRFWASSYRRTGTLGRSITADAKIAGDTVVGRIGTNVTKQTAASGYAEFVIGDPQAWMHAGRWWQLYVEVEKRIDVVVDSVGDSLENVIS